MQKIILTLLIIYSFTPLNAQKTNAKTPSKIIEKPIVYPDTLQIIFEDRATEIVVRKEIKKERGVITYQDIKLIDSLDLGSKNITQIGGIQYFTALRVLNLSNNKITDISQIATLKNMENLGLTNNPIPDEKSMTYLRQMKKLKKLYAGKIPIKDSITIVGSFVHLVELLAEGSDIKDISPLKNTPKMMRLYLKNNAIDNIKVVEGMKNLEVLTLQNNPIQDITPLTKITHLQTIDLKDTKITDITAVLGHHELMSLDISNTQVKDIVPLNTMSSLYSLFILGVDVGDNQIKHLKTKLPYLSIFK